jgi:predicted ATPase
MLTRIKIDGFKNLDGIDVRLGPFVCIAGPNGVGKSNFFDAIAFLSALADKPLIDAALSVRGGAGRMGDVRSLFKRVGESVSDQMSFLVEMIIPATGEDTLGQKAEASMTYLQYELHLRYRADTPGRPLGGIELVSERLVHLNRTTARQQLGFPHSKRWRESAIRGRRTSPYISTETKNGVNFVSLHADSAGGMTGGRPRQVPASSLPRTMLSSVNNAAEHRTLVLARQEMMSWIQLQLEPSALRSPDTFTAPHGIGANGAHLPATLYHLAHLAGQDERGGQENLYARVANRLSELIENVQLVAVDVDEKRQLLNIVMTDLQGTPHLAGSLSDGTLRFLALTVMEADPSPRAIICLEEPENGMHPRRIPAMLRLLRDLAVDPEEAVGADNPLRQVIVNTHSPSVVGEVPDDSLLVAQMIKQRAGQQRSFRLTFLPLPGTWRSEVVPKAPTIPRGVLLDYLNPLQGEDDERAEEGPPDDDEPRRRSRPAVRKVKERDDLQLFLPFPRPASGA